MSIVRVALGPRCYDIRIGAGILSGIGSRCARLGLGKRCAIITDKNAAPRNASIVQSSLRNAGFDHTLIVLRAGEQTKSLETIAKCYDRLAAHRLERSSFIVALGGGVVGDTAGFVAATYLRGIALVQAPTTLLAQVDSSVGGKVGVNLKAGKNLVGAFHQPRLVLCDLETMNGLPEREFRAGLAEVIKYAIIYDAALFTRLEREMPALLSRDSRALTGVIARCCQIKAKVVGQDETESGLRAILNFGHTIGHALEAVSHYGKYLHGEAISIGQVAAARLSARVLGLPQSAVDRIIALFEEAGLQTHVKHSRTQQSRLLEAMKLDKKVSGGQIKFVLAPQIGRAEFGHRVSADLIRDVLSS